MRNDTPKLESAAVKARLVNPRDLVVALRLVKPDAPSRAAYTVKCPWCGAISLSVWWPGPGKTVIATCKADRSGRCGGGANKTYSPFDLIAKAEDWDVLADFHTKVLPLADLVGRGGATNTVTTTAAPTTKSPQQDPAAAPTKNDGESEEEPFFERLHPDWTTNEWVNLSALGVDVAALRNRDWLAVVLAGDDQPAALRPRLAEGYTVWASTVDEDGAEAGRCEIYTASRTRPAWHATAETVVANEIARRMLSDGPRRLTAWPKAERTRPKLYVGLDPIDLLRTEPELQRRLLPILGITGKTIPGKILARVPAPCEVVVLLCGDFTKQHDDLVAAIEAAGRRACVQTLDGAVASLTPGLALDAAAIDAAVQGL